MTNSQIYNLMAIPIALVCGFISIRAFYIYRLSRSDMLFVLGLSMANISAGTCMGIISEFNLIGNNLNPDWTRTFAACCGGGFIFLSSLVRSHEQMQQLRRWQVIATIACAIVIVSTPLHPPIPNIQIALVLACSRIVIYSAAFIRYALLYSSKSTRFSLVMSIAFFVLVTGCCLNLPGMLDSQFAYFSAIAAGVRIVAYLTLLGAYSMK